MKNIISILAVCSKYEVDNLKSNLNLNTKEIVIKDEACNYKEALNLINSDKEYDAILVEANLNNESAINFLRKYNKDIDLSKTIVIDSVKLDCYNIPNSKYQLYNVVSTDYRLDDLIMSFKDIKLKKENYNYKKISIYEKISVILKQIGIAPDKNGFHYLRKGIYECYLNPRLLTSITKELYPLLAQTFEKKESCIERSIRSAIETGWDRGDYEYCEKLFASCIDFCRTKPTNGEFIAVIVDKLLLEDGRTSY